MSFLIWVAQRRWPWSPQWFQQWQHKQRIRWLQARQIPAMLAAQEAGVGLSEAWAGAGTSSDEILQLNAVGAVFDAPLTAPFGEHYGTG